MIPAFDQLQPARAQASSLLSVLCGKWVVLAVVAPVALAAPVLAQTYNVALDAPVFVVAKDPDPNAMFNNGTANNYNNVTDGVILPYGTGYNSPTAAQNAVEWGGAETVFQIDLGAAYTLSSIIVDADDNDEYLLQYLDPATGDWDALYTAPIVSEGVGIVPRAQYTLTTPITTTAVRFYGGQSLDNGCFDGTCDQGGYAVAQIELFGTPATGSTTETFDPANRQITIPALAIGNTTCFNTVLVTGDIVSGPSGSAPNGSEDSYDPASHQLTVQSVTVGSATYYNVVVGVTGLVSIGSAIGTDSYNGGLLKIPAVQVGNTVYTNVLLSVGPGNIIAVGGKIPAAAADSYDAATATLYIPSVSAFGTVYTNVQLRVTPAAVVYVGGSVAAPAGAQ